MVECFVFLRPLGLRLSEAEVRNGKESTRKLDSEFDTDIRKPERHPEWLIRATGHSDEGKWGFERVSRIDLVVQR